MHPLNPAPLLDKKTPASANKTIKNKKTFLNFHDDKPVSILKSSGKLDDENMLKQDDLNYINDNNDSNNNSNNDSNNNSNNDLMKKLYTQNNEIINKTIFTSNDNNSNSNANVNIDHPKPFIEPRNIE